VSKIESSPLILAIDQGGHASRAIVFDMTGRQLAHAFHPVATQRSGTDRVEQDPCEIVSATRHAIREVRDSLGKDAGRLKAAGLATQRSSIVCWDRVTGTPLSPVLSWQDRRGAAQVGRLRAREDFIREHTGLVLSPHYGASKMRWCLDNLSSVQEAAAAERLAIGPLSSYLLHSLLAEHPFLVDPANASRTQLWDVYAADWSPPLCELFGVPLEILPRSASSRYPFGSIDVDLADLSLPTTAHENTARLALTVCTGDQAAALFAHGEIRQDTVYLNMGTGAFLQCLAPDADISSSGVAGRARADALLRSIAWQDPYAAVQLTVMEGTVNGAGSALDWVDEKLSLDAHAVTRALTIAQVQPLHPPTFINGVSGVGSPYWRPQVESRWLDDGVAHTELEKLVAVVESIAFLICANLDAMRAAGARPRRVLASGGLSACDYLCYCVASISPMEVARTSLQETTATGLAFLATGQPRDWQPLSDVTTFKSVAGAALRGRYHQWQRFMAQQKA
jgi:glycerol kinase